MDLKYVVIAVVLAICPLSLAQDPPVHELGRSCSDDSQCQLGRPGVWSVCDASLKTCRCMDNAVNQPEQHVCILKADIVGQGCSTQIECTEGLGPNCACYLGQCLCSRNGGVASSDNKRCLPIINELDRECEQDQQCQTGSPGGLSECRNQTCQCKEGAINPLESHVCYKKAEIVTESCSQHIQCQAGLGPHSSCYLAQCLCSRNGGVPSSDNRRCLPVVHELDRECEQDQQCQTGAPGGLSECRNETCQCIEDAINVPESHVCYKKAEFVADPCSQHIQCHAGLGPFSQCYLEKCQCGRSGGIPSLDNRRCLPIIHELQRSCEESQQCKSGTPGEWSECSDSDQVCQCTEQGVNVIGTNNCLKKAELVGDPCSNEIQCKQGLGDLSTCSRSICSCVGEAVASENNTMCLPIINFLERGCSEDRQCQLGAPGENSHCGPSQGIIENVCKCNAGSTHECHEHVCLKLAEHVGETCAKDVQCQEGELGELSACVSGRCACQAGARLPPGDCLSKKCVPV